MHVHTSVVLVRRTSIDYKTRKGVEEHNETERFTACWVLLTFMDTKEEKGDGR